MKWVVKKPFSRLSSRLRDRSGDALIEAGGMIALLAFIMFAVFQMAFIYAAKQVVLNASTAGARARTVGFNDFMVHKVVRAATIPNAGHLLHPITARTTTFDPAAWTGIRPGEAFDAALGAYPQSAQAPVERSLIPLFLGSEDIEQMGGILDYADWETVHFPNVRDSGADLISIDVTQEYPLRFPFHSAFVDSDYLSLEATTRMDNHHPLYLQ